MAGGSGQGPHPSNGGSRISYDDTTSPPPPYSWTRQQKKQQQRQRPPPPPYQFEDPRVTERSSLLPRSEYGHQSVSVTRSTSTRVQWSARSSRREYQDTRREFQHTRRSSWIASGPCILLQMIFSISAFAFIFGFILYALWQCTMSAWPTTAPLPKYSVAIIGASLTPAPYYFASAFFLHCL